MDFRWTYRLKVGEVVVPVCWTQFRGTIRRTQPPKVFSGAALPDPAPPATETEVADAQSSDLLYADSVSSGGGDKENESPGECMPQGVSYDREAGSFQATIKDPKTNRFILLGEFASAGEAHEKYVEALSRYAPDKKLEPTLA